jgi:hypothetical protein
MTTMGGFIVCAHAPYLSMCFLIEQAVQSIPFQAHSAAPVEGTSIPARLSIRRIPTEYDDSFIRAIDHERTRTLRHDIQEMSLPLHLASLVFPIILDSETILDMHRDNNRCFPCFGHDFLYDEGSHRQRITA